MNRAAFHALHSFLCSSSHVGELHRVHRAAHQAGPVEVHAVQDSGEELPQGHDLAAPVWDHLPPGQQAHWRGAFIITLRHRDRKCQVGASHRRLQNVKAKSRANLFTPDEAFFLHQSHSDAVAFSPTLSLSLLPSHYTADPLSTHAIKLSHREGATK